MSYVRRGQAYYLSKIEVQSMSGHALAKMIYDTYNHTTLNRQNALMNEYQASLFGPNDSDLTDGADSLIEQIKNNPLLKKRVIEALFSISS